MFLRPRKFEVLLSPVTCDEGYVKTRCMETPDERFEDQSLESFILDSAFRGGKWKEQDNV